MNPQVSVITLGVESIDRAKKFYNEGLGCPIEKNHGKFVSFNLGEGSSSLALYTWDALADDAGVAPDGRGFRGLTLSYIVLSAERVDEVMAQAARAGGKVARRAESAQWGGYFGYFTDPDGYLWKVAAEAA